MADTDASPKGYSFPELIEIANEHYQDGYVNLRPSHFTAEGGVDYDSLERSLDASLLVELFETFDPEADKRTQLENAKRALTNVIDDVNRAVTGLEEQLEKLSKE